MYVPNTPFNVFIPRTASTATNSKVIKQYNAKPQISALLIASGLISAAISIWLLSVTLSAHAQEYCPSGAVVTAQSQCPGAVGPIDNLTKSILRLNNSGVTNANDTAIKIQKENKNNTAGQIVQSTISHSKMTRYKDPEGRFSISYPTNWTATPATNRFQTNAATFSHGLGSAVLVQVINSASSPELFARGMTIGMYGYMTFQDVECSKYKVDGNIACSFIETKSGDVNLGTRAITAIIVVTSINNKIYTIGLGSGQDTFDSMVPIFETMVNSFSAGTSSGSTGTSVPQQQPYPFQPYQQQPNNNYPPPRILSQSAYTDSSGTVHIVGEVVNQSPVTAKFVKIIVTFYNAYNQVIGTDNTYTEPSDLSPGQRAPFDILVTSGVPMNQVRNYALTVDAS